MMDPTINAKCLCNFLTDFVLNKLFSTIFVVIFIHNYCRSIVKREMLYIVI